MRLQEPQEAHEESGSTLGPGNEDRKVWLVKAELEESLCTGQQDVKVSQVSGHSVDFH